MVLPGSLLADANPPDGWRPRPATPFQATVPPWGGPPSDGLYFTEATRQQQQELNGGAHFHTPGGGTLVPMSSDPLSLLSLHPSQRKNKLKLTLRYLGNPERGELNAVQALEDMAAQARVSAVRADLHHLMHEHPPYILCLLSLVGSPEPSTQRVAAAAVHALLCSEPGAAGDRPGVSSMVAAAACGDSTQMASNFLLLDKLLPEAYGGTPQQVTVHMLEKLEGLLEDHDVHVRAQAAAILRFMLGVTMACWDRMAMAVAVRLFVCMGFMLRSGHQAVFHEGTLAARWLVQHNKRTLEWVLCGMDYPSLEVFLRDLTDCLRNWLPQVSGHEQPDQGDVGQVWGMVIEMARSAPARHKLVFVHGMLPTEVAADAVLTAHVLPYQMTFSRLLLELSESLKHPRKMVLAAYALHALVLEPDRPQTSTGVPAKMSCVEGVLMMHPDVCKLLMGLSTAFCALAGVDMRGAEACVQALTKVLHPEQVKRWVLLGATAGGVKDAGMIAELAGPTLCAAAQALCELAARAAEDGPMVAAVPGHVHAARTANDLALPNKQGGDPSQRTPVRLDLNNIFHGGSTPATHLALQVVLEGLHSALVCAPHATLEYMRLGVQQQLATALAVVAGTPRVEYVQVLAAQVLAVLARHTREQAVLTGEGAHALCKMMQVVMESSHNAAVHAAAVTAVHALVDKPNGGRVLCDIMRGGNYGVVHHVTWLFSASTATSADVMCEGLVHAVHTDDLAAVDKVLQLLARLVINPGDRFGYNALCRVSRPKLHGMVRRLTALLMRHVYAQHHAKHGALMIGMQRNAALLIQAFVGGDSWSADTAMRQVLESLAEPDCVALISALRQLEVTGDKDSDKVFSPSTSSLATHALNRMATRGVLASDFMARCVQNSLFRDS